MQDSDSVGVVYYNGSNENEGEMHNGNIILMGCQCSKRLGAKTEGGGSLSINRISLLVDIKWNGENLALDLNKRVYRCVSRPGGFPCYLKE